MGSILSDNYAHKEDMDIVHRLNFDAYGFSIWWPESSQMELGK